MPKEKYFDQDQALSNALEVFWAKGYNGTSISDLLEATGLSRSSLYDTFQDKHHLYRAALQLYQTQQMNDLSAVLDKQSSARKKIEALFHFFLHQIVTQPEGKGCFMVNTATEMLNQDKELSKIAHKDFEGMEQLFAGIVKEGQQRNEISKKHSPEILARFLFSAYLGFRITGQANADKKVLNQIISVTLDTLN